MATYLSPGVYVEEKPSEIKPIAGVGTSTVATARERTDIKVVGEQSKFNYSISLEVVTTK